MAELATEAVAREKSRTDAAEQKAQEQTMRGDREEKRTNEAENAFLIQGFIRLSGASEAYEHWNFLHDVVKKAAQALADWAHRFVWDQARGCGLMQEQNDTTKGLAVSANPLLNHY